jgi:hypothetical protein
MPNGGGGPAKGTPAEELAEGANFLIQKVVFSEDGPDSPKPELHGLEEVLKGASAADPRAFLGHVTGCIRNAVRAWKAGTLSEGGRDLLQACLEKGLLTPRASATPALQDAVAAYRKAAAMLGKPVSVPGVVEHEGRPARLLTRGDPKKAGDEVPRGFLEVLHKKPFESPQSGRLELAGQLVSPHNPLTARVLVNRLWHWVFGAGIVPTVDDFGRMGEKPTHPELLDFLATRLTQTGWSARQMILWLVETEAFQRSALPSESALERDPSNALLSHATVRRLDAEEIRDSMLAVAGTLQREPYGAPVDVGVPRRSIYVRHRRAGLPPLFAAFDAPRPFTTLGRRSVTTVPAQSLLLLNDPSILKLAASWGDLAQKKPSPLENQIDDMFETAFGRKASAAERDRAAALARENGLAAVAHALFNAKEFIYLR